MMQLLLDMEKLKTKHSNSMYEFQFIGGSMAKEVVGEKISRAIKMQ